MEFTQEQLFQIRAIVKETMRQESNQLFAKDRFIFRKPIALDDGVNFPFGKGTGTKLGTATDQKLAFYGVTPVDQPATVADPSGGAVQDASARAAVEAVIDRLQELGLIA